MKHTVLIIALSLTAVFIVFCFSSGSEKKPVKIEGTEVQPHYLILTPPDTWTKVFITFPLTKEESWICEIMETEAYSRPTCTFEAEKFTFRTIHDWNLEKIQKTLAENPDGKYICKGHHTKVDVTYLYSHYSEFSEHLKICVPPQGSSGVESDSGYGSPPDF